MIYRIVIGNPFICLKHGPNFLFLTACSAVMIYRSRNGHYQEGRRAESLLFEMILSCHHDITRDFTPSYVNAIIKNVYYCFRNSGSLAGFTRSCGNDSIENARRAQSLLLLEMSIHHSQEPKQE